MTWVVDLFNLERSALKRHWQLFARKHLFPREPKETNYHFAVIRSQLTRSLATLCPRIKDEIVVAFDEVLDLKGSGEHGFDMNRCAFISEMLRVAKCTCPGHRATDHLQNKQQDVRRPSLVYFFFLCRSLVFYSLIA